MSPLLDRLLKTDSSMTDEEFRGLARVVIGLSKRLLRTGMPLRDLVQEGWEAATLARRHYYASIVPRGLATAPMEAYAATAVKFRLMNYAIESRSPVKGAKNKPGKVIHGYRVGDLRTTSVPSDAEIELSLDSPFRADEAVSEALDRERVSSMVRAAASRHVEDDVDELALLVLAEVTSLEEAARDWGLVPLALRERVKALREALRSDPTLISLARGLDPADEWG